MLQKSGLWVNFGNKVEETEGRKVSPDFREAGEKWGQNTFRVTESGGLTEGIRWEGRMCRGHGVETGQRDPAGLSWFPVWASTDCRRGSKAGAEAEEASQHWKRSKEAEKSRWGWLRHVSSRGREENPWVCFGSWKIPICLTDNLGTGSLTCYFVWV